MTTRRRERGMAIPVVVAIIFVLGVLVMALSRFQRFQIRVTGASANDFAALMGAEAGLHCALAEMRLNQVWATHQLEVDGDGEPLWKNAVDRTLKLRPNVSGLRIDASGRGTYSGRVGKDPFAAEFKVRVGQFQLEDDPDTPNVDESKRYWLVESMGRRVDPTKTMDRHACIRVVVNRSNFTEYVMFDGEKVSIGMGSYFDRNAFNIFADGSIYGHQYVKLGDIAGGTRQRFVNLKKIRSAGPILSWNDYQITFQTLDPASPVAFGPSNDSDGPGTYEEGGGNILDGDHGGAATVPAIDVDFYREQARSGGIDVSGLATKPRNMPSYTEAQQDAIHLNFGHAGYESSELGLAADDENTLKRGYPSNFNGLIYSSKPVVVWGNPDRDVTIFCEEDVYIAGDFNTRRDARQNYKPGYRGFADVKYYDYQDDSKVRFSDPADPTARIDEGPDKGKEQRKSCAIITNKQCWRDHRYPARLFRNELKGLMKYELVKRLKVASKIIRNGASPSAAETQAENEVLDWIAYPEHMPAGGSKPDIDLDCSKTSPHKIVQAYFDRDYTGPAPGGESPANPAKDPGQSCWLTPESWAEVLDAFERATADGKLDRDELDGTGADKGILDLVLDKMEEDEDRWQEFADGSQSVDKYIQLGSFNAPQRLYDLVYDERDAGQGAGPHSDQAGEKPDAQKDELYMPQMTFHAMVFSNSKRNDPLRDADGDSPTSQNKRYLELGNPRGSAQGLHYLSTKAMRAGDAGNIIHPMIQRFVGSEIRLAQGPPGQPQLQTGYYWPPIRRRIYDPELIYHPPPLILLTMEIKDWKQRGCNEKDWTAF